MKRTTNASNLQSRSCADRQAHNVFLPSVVRHVIGDCGVKPPNSPTNGEESRPRCEINSHRVAHHIYFNP